MRMGEEQAIDSLRLLHRGLKAMGILSWLKRRGPVELDDDDFKEEIRAHVAIAAEGEDLRRRRSRGCAVRRPKGSSATSR